MFDVFENFWRCNSIYLKRLGEENLKHFQNIWISPKISVIIFGGTQHFWYLQVHLNFKDDHVWICVTTEIQFATDHCSGSGLCTVRGNLKFYIFGDNLQLWYLPMSNLIILFPQLSNGVFALIFFFTKVWSHIFKTILCLNICTRWQNGHLLKTGIC